MSNDTARASDAFAIGAGVPRPSRTKRARTAPNSGPTSGEVMKSPRRPARPLDVSLTATGAVLSMLAMLAAVDGKWSLMFL